MHSEDVKKIKCDRCGGVIGLFRHRKGWRCPTCIWSERENLIEWARDVLGSGNYADTTSETKQMVVVSRRSMDALAKVIRDVTL